MIEKPADMTELRTAMQKSMQRNWLQRKLGFVNGTIIDGYDSSKFHELWHQWFGSALYNDGTGRRKHSILSCNCGALGIINNKGKQQ